MSVRAALREASSKAIRFSGLPNAIMRIRRSRAAIAFYHDPHPEVFESHLRFLRAHFEFTTVDAIVDALVAGDWSAIPPRALAVTFDDGHRGNYRLLPLFRRYELRPLIYVCTRIVATQNGFWFNEPVDEQPLKRLANRDRLAALERATGFRPGSPRPGPRQALSRQEMLEMAEWVDFGSHTRTHPILTQCSDAEARDEIEGSKSDLEQLLGRPCRHFAFPNGDRGEREIELVRRAGFDSARTSDVGWAGPGSDRYWLPVALVSDEASVDMLAAQISGLPRYLKNLARGHLGGQWPQLPVAREGSGAKDRLRETG